MRGQEPPARALADELYRREGRRLFWLAYRMTGTREDADDVVQEAFVRLVSESEPVERPTGWLVRVVSRLAVDVLRRRRRRAYVGPWLPEPVETPPDDGLDELPSGTPDPEQRYGEMESVTFAFLLALEALGPRQRAVLVLRDAVGQTVRETAEALSTSEANVRVLHHRARRALEAYDRARCVPNRAMRERHRAALEAFLAALESQDGARVESLLSESASTLTDAGGSYTALPARLAGRRSVARFYLAATQHRQRGGTRRALCLVNGLPAALVTVVHPVRRQAPHTLLRCELDAEGRIAEVQALLAPPKLLRLPFPG